MATVAGLDQRKQQDEHTGEGSNSGPTEVEVNWEYALNVEHPSPMLQGVAQGATSSFSSSSNPAGTVGGTDRLDPLPASLVYVDPDGYVKKTDADWWIGYFAWLRVVYSLCCC